MSRFSTLVHGQPEDVINALEYEPADEQELRAALQNAFVRIQSLERLIRQKADKEPVAVKEASHG